MSLLTSGITCFEDDPVLTSDLGFRAFSQVSLSSQRSFTSLDARALSFTSIHGLQATY